MSFQEKSLVVSLVGLVLASGLYFKSAITILVPDVSVKDVLPAQSGLLIAATCLLVVVIVVGNVALALLDKRTEADERDRSIELRAVRYGSYALATGVFFSLCAAAVTEGNAIMAHVLLGSWVLAQCIETIAQLVMYRRGS